MSVELSMEAPFVEKLGRASLEEVEAMWQEALQEFMERIGVPERLGEAAASVRRDPAWTGLAVDWITLPTVIRQTRYGELLSALERAGYATRQECLRCGDCCRGASPSLFLDDLRLLTEGVVKRSQIFTLRRGEAVSLPAPLGTMVLRDETIKLREHPETGYCLFFDDDENHCGIYFDRPLQCRAQACWDTQVIEHAVKHEERLSRAHVLSPDEPVAEALLAHEAHCALEPIADAFAAVAQGEEQALELILDALAYDAQLRPLLVDKLPLPADELDFVFGRPLSRVVEMYGVRVAPQPDGSFELVPLAADAPPGEAE
ncbi:MAG: YkgJ family cysteine cluster protein [bacterium]